MRRRRTVKYIHEGRYVAAVSIELIRDETGWSPYLTLEDACKLGGGIRLREIEGLFHLCDTG
jgi:hypothetical protein